jgi:hypothetical protein
VTTQMQGPEATMMLDPCQRRASSGVRSHLGAKQSEHPIWDQAPARHNRETPTPNSTGAPTHNSNPRVLDTMATGRISACLLRSLQTQQRPIGPAIPKWPQPNISATTSSRLAPRRPFSNTPRRPKQAADDPGFTSVVDNPPDLVRTGRRHGPGLIILGNPPSLPHHHRSLTYPPTPLTNTPDHHQPSSP